MRRIIESILLILLGVIKLICIRKWTVLIAVPNIFDFKLILRLCITKTIISASPLFIELLISCIHHSFVLRSCLQIHQLILPLFDEDAIVIITIISFEEFIFTFESLVFFNQSISFFGDFTQPWIA